MNLKASFVLCCMISASFMFLAFHEAKRYQALPLPAHATILFREGKVVEFDAGAEQLTGVRRSLAIGKHTGAFLANPEIEFAGSGDTFSKATLTIFRADGSILETPATLFWSNGRYGPRTFSVRVDIDSEIKSENDS